MTKRAWPFMAAAHLRPQKADEVEAPEEEEVLEHPFCGCNLEPMLSELDSGKCRCCGRPYQ